MFFLSRDLSCLVFMELYMMAFFLLFFKWVFLLRTERGSVGSDGR